MREAGRSQVGQKGQDRLGGEVLVDVVPTEIAHGGWAAGDVGHSDLGLGAGAQLGQGPAGRGDVHGHLSQGEHVAEPQPGQPGLRVLGTPQSLIGVVKYEGHPRGGGAGELDRQGKVGDGKDRTGVLRRRRSACGISSTSRLGQLGLRPQHPQCFPQWVRLGALG